MIRQNKGRFLLVRRIRSVDSCGPLIKLRAIYEQILLVLFTCHLILENTLYNCWSLNMGTVNTALYEYDDSISQCCIVFIGEADL